MWPDVGIGQIASLDSVVASTILLTYAQTTPIVQIPVALVPTFILAKTCQKIKSHIICRLFRMVTDPSSSIRITRFNTPTMASIHRRQHLLQKSQQNQSCQTRASSVSNAPTLIASTAIRHQLRLSSLRWFFLKMLARMERNVKTLNVSSLILVQQLPAA